MWSPDPPLGRRLAVVQREIRSAVDRVPSGPVQVISVCAGQGRDLIGALADHPRAGDVRARLVELDPHNAEVARGAARPAGLKRVEVFCADASESDAYAGAAAGQIVLLCGVFGNISTRDIVCTIRHLPTLCSARATVIWTRYR